MIDWLLIVLPGVIWGASFLFIAEGLTAVAPDGVTFIRILIGFLTLSLVPGARKPIVRSDWKGVAALGLLWFAFPMSMFPHAEQWISSALTGMLNGTVPLFATAVAAVLQRRWPPSMVAVGIAAGLFGGVLMAWSGLGAGGNSALGIVLVIAACISYGFAVNLARPAAAAQRCAAGGLAGAAGRADPDGAAGPAARPARPLDAARRCCRSWPWAPSARASPT